MTALVELIEGKVEPRRIWMEFGVAGGATLRELATKAPLIYGFDSWEGLPEDWYDDRGNLQEPKGTFQCDPPSNLPDNVKLVKGLFQDTLPDFMKHIQYPLGLVHIDCDLYSSTKFVLEQLEPWLDKTVIAFDEIGPFPAGEFHERRAFNEFIAKGKYRAELIGRQHTNGEIHKIYLRQGITSSWH